MGYITEGIGDHLAQPGDGIPQCAPQCGDGGIAETAERAGGSKAALRIGVMQLPAQSRHRHLRSQGKVAQGFGCAHRQKGVRSLEVGEQQRQSRQRVAPKIAQVRDGGIAAVRGGIRGQAHQRGQTSGADPGESSNRVWHSPIAAGLGGQPLQRGDGRTGGFAKNEETGSASGDLGRNSLLPAIKPGKPARRQAPRGDSPQGTFPCGRLAAKPGHQPRKGCGAATAQGVPGIAVVQDGERRVAARSARVVIVVAVEPVTKRAALVLRWLLASKQGDHCNRRNRAGNEAAPFSTLRHFGIKMEGLYV